MAQQQQDPYGEKSILDSLAGVGKSIGGGLADFGTDLGVSFYENMPWTANLINKAADLGGALLDPVAYAQGNRQLPSNQEAIDTALMNRRLKRRNEDARNQLRQKLEARIQADQRMYGKLSPQTAAHVQRFNQPMTMLSPQEQRIRDEIKKQEALRNLDAEKEEKVKTRPDGSTETQTRYKTKDKEVTVKRRGNRYEDQYVQALQQQMSPQPQTQANLAPVMGFIDQFTGSNLSQMYEDPRIRQEKELRRRLGASKALFDIDEQRMRQEEGREFKERELDLREKQIDQQGALGRARLAAQRAKAGDEGEDWTQYSRKQRKDKQIIGASELLKSVRGYAGKIPELLASRGVPKHYIGMIDRLSTLEQADEIDEVINDLEAMEAYRYKQAGESDKWIKKNWGNIRNKVAKNLEKIRGQ